jgi:phosphatidylserine decarboxylase
MYYFCTMKLHREGWWYCVAATVIYFVLLVATSQLFPHFSIPFFIVAILLGLVWFWVFWFFRIPTRAQLTGDSFVMSPCDGKVVVIEETTETEYFKDKRIQVSIFMSPLNVHVNLYPIAGIVQYVQYHAGKFLVAWHPKSSTENERSTVVVKNEKTEILFRQIAGAVARRIITYAKKGDIATQNNEFGFIKFGSRVDLFLPIGTKIACKIGDVVQGGVSQIATV